MSRYVPVPWRFSCAWCDYAMLVSPRGARGNDPGSGVEAARAMQAHLDRRHPGRTLDEMRKGER